MSTVSSSGGFEEQRRDSTPRQRTPITPEKFGGGSIGTLLAHLVQRGSVDESKLFESAAILKRLPSALIADFKAYGSQLCQLSAFSVYDEVPRLSVSPIYADTTAALRTLRDLCPSRISGDVYPLLASIVARARHVARDALLASIPESSSEGARATVRDAFQRPEILLEDFRTFRQIVIAAEIGLISERSFFEYRDILANMKRPLVNGDDGMLRPANYDPESKFAPLRYVQALLEGFLRVQNERILREYEHLGGVQASVAREQKDSGVIDLRKATFGSVPGGSVDAGRSAERSRIEGERALRSHFLRETFPAVTKTLATYVANFERERGVSRG